MSPHGLFLLFAKIAGSFMKGVINMSRKVLAITAIIGGALLMCFGFTCVFVASMI